MKDMERCARGINKLGPLIQHLTFTSKAVFACEVAYTVQAIFECVDAIVVRECEPKAANALTNMRVRFDVSFSRQCSVID